MDTHDSGLADVVYRATAGARLVELRLALEPAAATVADAWARLSAMDAEVDPWTLEIEIRRGRIGSRRCRM